MRDSLYDYCMENGMEHLLEQWDQEKNQGITPFLVSRASNKKVWWCCEKGHEWAAAVSHRTRGQCCPVCAGRKILMGVNDLASTNPDLVTEWHPLKNGELTPQMVFAGSVRKVWWQCDKRHEWEAAISSRAKQGSGCPVCAGKVVVPGLNDLESNYPEIAAQWHPTMNGTLKPNAVALFSSRRFWWCCDKGHEWRTTVASRTAKASECPVCSGKKVLAGFNDLATTHPELAAQWHPSLNESLTPQMVTRGSNKRVWWQCPVGHVWKAAVYSRTGKERCGCPVCAGKVKERRHCDDILEDALQDEFRKKG